MAFRGVLSQPGDGVIRTGDGTEISTTKRGSTVSLATQNTVMQNTLQEVLEELRTMNLHLSVVSEL